LQGVAPVPWLAEGAELGGTGRKELFEAFWVNLRPEQASCQVADFHRKLFETGAKDLTVSGFLLILPCLSGKVFP
jgi:hypothetical protein